MIGYLVSAIDTARDELQRRVAEISEPFYNAGSMFAYAGARGRLS